MHSELLLFARTHSAQWLPAFCDPYCSAYKSSKRTPFWEGRGPSPRFALLPLCYTCSHLQFHLFTAILSTFHQSYSGWAVLPCCYGDPLVNIPNVFLPDKSPAVRHREINGTFLQQNRQRFQRGGQRKELVGGRGELWKLVLIKRVPCRVLTVPALVGIQYRRDNTTKPLCNCLIMRMLWLWCKHSAKQKGPTVFRVQAPKPKCVFSAAWYITLHTIY